MNFALDRRSSRRKDVDGHLHVEGSNITKANVRPYRGDEVPDWRTLGLNASRIYKLYCDPAELAAAASTFTGKPLLLSHKPVTSDDHPTELVIGAVGTVDWRAPYLRAPLSVWRQDAIEAIESGAQCELSAGYRYTPFMTPGVTPDGVRFDGRMRLIRGNHVTIVKTGRAGSDVVVADAAPSVAFDPVILGISHIRRG